MDISVFHVTTEGAAQKILREGFINSRTGYSGSSGRIYFTKVSFIDTWKEILFKGRNLKPVVLQVVIPHEFYHQEFYDWDLDEFSSGPPGQVTYGEGVYGWNAPERRPYLQPGVNCAISIYKG